MSLSCSFPLVFLLNTDIELTVKPILPWPHPGPTPAPQQWSSALSLSITLQDDRQTVWRSCLALNHILTIPIYSLIRMCPPPQHHIEFVLPILLILRSIISVVQPATFHVEVPILLVLHIYTFSLVYQPVLKTLPRSVGHELVG